MEAELATGRVRVAAATGPEGRLTKQRAVSSKLPSSSFPLPIAQTIAILHKWGIHTLGQLAALKIESGAKHYNTTHSDKVRISETGVSKCSP